MNWHKATEAPKNGEKCLLRVIRDNGKNEIRMGTACVFINAHCWHDEDDNFETWEIKRVKCWCPVDEIEADLDKEEERMACLYQYLLGEYAMGNDT